MGKQAIIRSSKLFLLSILMLMATCLLPSSVAIAAAPACLSVHSSAAAKFAQSLPEGLPARNRLAKAILAFEALLGAGNTTSLRQEDKYVITNQHVENVLNKFEADFGEQFILRDKKTAGRKNVTQTQYALPIIIAANKAHGKLSAKFRFRKYFTADENVALKDASLVPAEFVKGTQFLEMKIDHPQYERTVVKPRILVNDIDALMMQKKDLFYKNLVELKRRAKLLNPKTPAEVIEHFFEVLSLGFDQMDSRIPLFAKTTYVRDSYSLMLSGKNGEKVEVQLTVDREVSVLDNRTGKVVDAYDANQAVVEIKIPLAYASLNQTVLATVPGLKIVKDLKEQLSEQHIDQFRVGAGKLSTFKRLSRQTADLVTDN